MKMKFFILIGILFLFAFVSCSPQNIKPWTPPEVKFEKTPPYSIKEELDNIPKPDPPVKIYVKQIDNKTFVVTNEAESTHRMFAPKEYAKIGAVIKLVKIYKSLILDQEKVINMYISQINALKELYELEQIKSRQYRELWISSENAYRQEVRDHKFDNAVNKTALYGVTVGSIIVLLLML